MVAIDINLSNYLLLFLSKVKREYDEAISYGIRRLYRT